MKLNNAGSAANNCDLTPSHLMSQEATTQTPPTFIVPGQSMSHEISIKDGVVIGFMLGLWLYSIVLMFRAWSKMLNFSDDQGARPEKAAVLWKWVMEHVINKRKERRKNEDGCSTNHSSIKNSQLETKEESFDRLEVKPCSTDERTEEEGGNHAEDANEMIHDENIVVIHNNSFTEDHHNNSAKLDTYSCASSLDEADKNPCGGSSKVVCLELECEQPISCNKSMEDPIRPTAAAAAASVKRPRFLPRQAKSLGQYEFKAMALASDLSQVQEKLATLDETIKGCSLDESADYEMESLHSDPPELPPKDYYEAEDMV